MKFASVAVLALMLTAACASQPSTSDPVFTKADAELLRQQSTALAAAINAKNIDEILGFFHRDSVLLPSQQPTVRGYDSIRAFYEELFASGPLEVEADIADVGGNGTLAYETGQYAVVRHATTDDGQSMRDRGKYVYVWRHRGEKWQIDYTIWASDLREPVQVASH